MSNETKETIFTIIDDFIQYIDDKGSIEKYRGYADENIDTIDFQIKKITEKIKCMIYWVHMK